MEECPAFGSEELGQGKQTGEGRMLPLHSFFKGGSTIIATICLDCGHKIRRETIENTKG